MLEVALEAEDCGHQLGMTELGGGPSLPPGAEAGLLFLHRSATACLAPKASTVTKLGGKRATEALGKCTFSSCSITYIAAVTCEALYQGRTPFSIHHTLCRTHCLNLIEEAAEAQRG